MSEPIELRVTRYKCPHCRRSWSKRKTAAGHITWCWFNPDNKSCKTCEHYEEGGSEPTISWDERCFLGIELPKHEFREGVIMLPLHCPKWKRETLELGIDGDYHFRTPLRPEAPTKGGTE